MKTHLKPVRILLAGLIFLVLFHAPAPAQIEGVYEQIGPIPAQHSLDVVVLEEFLNFQCPHCNNFRNLSKPLFKKYGNRVRKINVPILFRGQNDLPLRLYFIAEKKGQGPQVKELLFDTQHNYGYNVHLPQVVGHVARQAGLWEAFQKEYTESWVSDKVQAAMARADAAGVRGTPTIVLNNALRLTPRTGMNIFVKNLDRIIAQLLKRQE